MFKLSCKKFLFFLWDHLLRCQADLGSSSLPPWPASCVNGAAEALTSVYTPPPETKSYSVALADLEFVIVFCLGLSNARMIGVSHHVRFTILVKLDSVCIHRHTQASKCI